MGKRFLSLYYTNVHSKCTLEIYAIKLVMYPYMQRLGGGLFSHLLWCFYIIYNNRENLLCAFEFFWVDVSGIEKWPQKSLTKKKTKEQNLNIFYIYPSIIFIFCIQNCTPASACVGMGIYKIIQHNRMPKGAVGEFYSCCTLKMVYEKWY